ncbi:alpha/beta fold hydrolase [Marisediminicola senii]|uniref:alpha/beta fold hydrolase n=1 Tax=Marisediminicola senii TaxID=2711233 RepID=UPI0013E9B902|nr:alpha/beta hydrolase [Marisediminicola senii]
MDTVTSADGTSIAFERTGSGPVVVIVNGAMSTAADAADLAAALVGTGLSAIAYDRRGRGSSGDVKGSTPDREVEDLAAVIDVAGDDAAIFGHSSGAVLALLATSVGVPSSALFLSEPPFRFGVHEPAPDLATRLQDHVDRGEPEEALMTFQRDAVGLPEEMIEQIRTSGVLASLVPLAQSTVYDTLLTSQVSTPTPAMLGVAQPVTVMRGEQTFAVLVAAADRLASAIDHAELVVVPESVMHRPDPAATARVISERMAH